MMKVIKRGALVLLALLLVAFIYTGYENRYKIYYKYLGGKPAIVMLGSTLTQDGHWHLLLERPDVIYVGLPEPATPEAITAASEKVKKFAPKICFIEGGVNELVRGKEIETIKQNIDYLATTLKSSGVLPVVELNAYSLSDTLRNRKIDALNQALIKVADQVGADYIDLNTALSANGFLQKQYGKEPALFTRDAYPQWAVLVSKTIQKHKIN